jgi:shikimate dehydrogenase
MSGNQTKLFCLIGDPVEHSLSPKMINAAFREMGKDCVYLAFRVRKEDLGITIKGLKALGFLGCNVTIPHKVSVKEHLDRIDESARLSGAVNVISNSAGELIGYNTDGAGALKALEAGGRRLSGAKVLILGYGGAARGVAFEIAQKGNPAELAISGRSLSKALSLAREVSALAPAHAIPLSGCREARADIIINCTPVGMWPKINVSLLKAEDLGANCTVMDLVYTPPETELMRLARLRGCKIISGLEMLVQQGARAFEIWLGEPAPIDVMRRALSGDAALQPGWKLS